MVQLMPVSIPKYLITGDMNLSTRYRFNGAFGKPIDLDGIRKVFETLLARKKAA
jgi:hypothetical protein